MAGQPPSPPPAAPEAPPPQAAADAPAALPPHATGTEPPGPPGDRGATPPPPRRRRRWLLIALLLPLLLIAALAGALYGALHSERGSAWLLARVPGLQIEQPRGALLGDFSAQQLDLALGAGGTRLHVERLAWQGASLSASEARGWRWPQLQLRALDIERLQIELPPKKEGPREPATAPTRLALPLRVRIDALRVGELQLSGLAQPVRELKAQVDLGGADGAQHRIDQLALAWDRLRLQGEARIGSAAPLPLQARLVLRQAEGAAAPGAVPADWSATLRLDGPLAQLPAQATLAAAGQSLDARAVLTPFAAQPLQALDARFEALDLAALHSAAPATALSGTAQLQLPQGSGGSLPLELKLALRNAASGPWDERRVPLRELQLHASGQGRDLAAGVEVHTFDARLGTSDRPAGRVQGSARWAPRQWSTELQIEQLEPAVLDARAPAMRLSGPLQLRSAAPGTATPPPSPATWPIELQARLEGQALGSPRPVALVLDGRYSPQTLLLRRFEAASGEARLRLNGELTPPDPRQAMRLKLQAELAQFDPVLWWPGMPEGPWRAGPHRLHGRGQADLRLTPRRADQPLPEWLAALQGEATLVLTEPSQLAGLLLAAELQLRRPAAQEALATSGRVELAGNRLHWEGRADTQGLGAAGTPLRFELQAPALARLGPLMRLLGLDGEAAGTLALQGEAAGRWSALAGRGELQGSGLRLASVQAGQLAGRFQLGLRADAPLELRLEGRQLQLAGRPVDTALLQLQGSALAHELTLDAETAMTPPAAPQPAARPVPTRLQARLQGGFELPGADTPWTALQGWRGTLRQFELAPRQAAAQPWLRVGEVAAHWQRGRAAAPAQPQSLTLSAGRAEVLGAGLRWSRLLWQAAAPGRAAVLDAQLELEPLLVAPWLRQLQPDFGWSGDLRVAGKLNLRSAPSFEADLELSRTEGDLAVVEAGAAEAIGLSELRLVGSARNGLWRFTQNIVGRRLGTLRGEQTVRARPQDLWPSADAALQGMLAAEVADLGALGTWLPPGWRLGGQLSVHAELGGRFGAPEYTGVVTGKALSARNILQGVNLTNGELVVALQGPTARILTAEARAGNGTVRLEGSATFGATPRADLRVVAERFAVLQRVDRRVVGSGQARLQLEADSLRLDGNFKVDEALIDISRSDAPSLSDDVVVHRGGIDDSAAASPTAQRSVRRKIEMDLAIDLGEQLRLRGRGLDTRLTGRLRLSAPGGRLALNGVIRTVGGSYAAYGQNLVVERGVIVFSGPLDNPRLNIEATRPKLDVRVGVRISGTAQNPRIRLFSEPELSETEKLTWLVLGRSYSNLAGAEAAVLQTAAMALLAGDEGGDTPTSQITQALGLDTLSFGQGTPGDVRSTIVTLGKQLSERWYLGYEHSLNATSGTWQLIYRAAQRFMLRAEASTEHRAVDMIWNWKW